MRALGVVPVVVGLWSLTFAPPASAQVDARLELPAAVGHAAGVAMETGAEARVSLAAALGREDDGGRPAWVWGAVIGAGAGAAFGGLIALGLRDAGLASADDEDVVVPIVLWASGGALVGGVIAALIGD